MPNTFKPIDLSQVKIYPISKRKSKVSNTDFAKVWQKGAGYKDFLDRLPDILAGSHIKKVISLIATAFRNKKTVVLAMGAHVIKVGLNPVVIDLMERGIVNAVAMNGAGIIHDFEVAYVGKTSEDVGEVLNKGTFGMAEETAKYLNEATKEAKQKGIGLGKAVG